MALATDSRWSSWLLRILSPVVSVVLAFALAAALISVTDVHPADAFRALLQGSVGDGYALSVSLVRMTPLLLAGLGVAVAFRAGIFNIGAEGQLYLGALGSTVAALRFAYLPPYLLLPIAVFAGFAGGMIWASVAAVLKAYRGVSEVVVTLMMNFIGILFIRYMLDVDRGPLAEPGASFSQSPPIPEGAQLPLIVPETSVHAGLLIGIVLAVVLYVLIKFTSIGFRLRVMGANPRAADFAHMRTKRLVLVVMAVSGGIAGLAGATEVLGLKYRLFTDFSPGYGYEAIAVALLARSNPLAAIGTAGFLGALQAGAERMQQVTGLESSVALVVQALVIVFVVAGVFVGRGPRIGRAPPSDIRPGEGVADAV
jgi:ABC-type uncharacterized transport system permease subunit